MSSFAIKEIFPLLKNYRFLGNENKTIDQVANFEQRGNWENSVMWLSEAAQEKNQSSIHFDIGLLVLTEKSYKKLPKKPQNALLVGQPRETFQQILSTFFEKKWGPKVEHTAIVHPSVTIPTSC